jgi:hypothetical protein
VYQDDPDCIQQLPQSYGVTYELIGLLTWEDFGYNYQDVISFIMDDGSSEVPRLHSFVDQVHEFYLFDDCDDEIHSGVTIQVTEDYFGQNEEKKEETLHSEQASGPSLKRRKLLPS